MVEDRVVSGADNLLREVPNPIRSNLSLQDPAKWTEKQRCVNGAGVCGKHRCHIALRQLDGVLP